MEYDLTHRYACLDSGQVPNNLLGTAARWPTDGLGKSRLPPILRFGTTQANGRLALSRLLVRSRSSPKQRNKACHRSSVAMSESTAPSLDAARPIRTVISL